MVSLYSEILCLAEDGLQTGKEKEALQEIITRVQAILDTQKDWKRT